MTKKEQVGTFVGGAVTGLALALAGYAFFSSKMGKKMTKEAQQILADFYQYIGPKLAEIKKMKKEEYADFIKTAVEDFAQVKKISSQAAKDLMNQAQESWQHFAG